MWEVSAQIGDAGGYEPTLVSQGPGGFQAVFARGRDAFVCSLFPTRGVRGANPPAGVDSKQGPMATEELWFCLTDRGRAGVALWAGGTLSERVASITYTFPNGERATAEVLERSWVLAYETNVPFLPDGRPLNQLPPVEVDVVDADGVTTHHTIQFTAESTCAQDLPIAWPDEPGGNDLCGK